MILLKDYYFSVCNGFSFESKLDIVIVSASSIKSIVYKDSKNQASGFAPLLSWSSPTRD